MAVRYYKEEDQQQVEALYQKVFRKERSPEHWNWKFERRPSDLNPFILVFEEEGQILGHIALWVAEAYIKGNSSKIALRVDTMVDPKARGKGIYGQLNQTMLEEAGKHQIDLLYGFPAPKAKELLLRHTGGVHAGDISRYMMVMNPGPPAAGVLPLLKPLLAVAGNVYRHGKLKKLSFLPAGWEFNEVNHFDQRCDALAEAAAGLKPVLLKRGSDYLNWRFLEHPDHPYTAYSLSQEGELKGYIILKKEQVAFKKGRVTVGHIVDGLTFGDQRNWEYLFTEAIRKLGDTDIIQTWMAPGGPAAGALEQIGFKEKDKPMPLVIHRLNEEYSEADKLENWWITQGDVDSF
ncbi:GNAT family N-acetyltransferase [Virgibacillus sediminis]|uniref:GNAT family N-acetyltransferase n=1 Tax=Virgibacillus sediminis TaxID=202260 RepID=A0ABV7A401_9BACI